jgi:hypothetical protein
MTFTEAMKLRIGDRIHRPDDPEHFGVIADIKRGVWRVSWSRNSGIFSHREEIPMGCVAKLEVLR